MVALAQRNSSKNVICQGIYSGQVIHLQASLLNMISKEICYLYIHTTARHFRTHQRQMEKPEREVHHNQNKVREHDHYTIALHIIKI